MKHLKKIEWLPDALSDGTIVTPDGPYTIPPEQAIQYADYRFNKQQSMMPYNTVIALDRGKDCSNRNEPGTTFVKTFLSKVGKSPVLIASELLPPNVTTGDTQFDQTYPFWCLAVKIISSDIDLTDTYLCLEACNTGHSHQAHYWWYQNQFESFPLEAKKYLTKGVEKYKTLPDSKSFSFNVTKQAEARANIKLSVDGVTQIKNPKVGKIYFLYIALPHKYLKYKSKVCNKANITDRNWNTYIKFRPCIKYKHENPYDLNIYTLPLSSPYELNCKFPELFYSAWSTNTTTLPPPVIGVYYDIIPATYIGKTITFGYSVEWPIDDVQIEFSSSASWLTYTHDPVNKEITLTIASTTSTSSRTAYFSLHYLGATSRRIEITQTGVPVINLSSSSIPANSLGGIWNIPYNITNPQENVTISTAESYDWITVGGDDSHISVTVDRNSTTSGRVGYIYVTYTGATRKTITVSQEACPVISTNNSQVTFSYNQSGASAIVSYDIVNPLSGEVASYSKSGSWFSVSNNTSTKQLTITVLSTNTSTTARSGTIYLYYENASSVVITVNQKGKTNTTAPVTTYSYNIDATITGSFSGYITSATISAQNTNTGETGKTQSIIGGNTSLHITQTFTFDSAVPNMTIWATVRVSGSGIAYTGSKTISYPTTMGINTVTIPVGTTASIAAASINDDEPDSSSGDSNSLEGTLVDYETDQI